MADNLGPNGLVVSAGKCAASMAAENCYRRKFLLVPFLIFRPFRFFVFFRNYNRSRMDFPHEVRFSAGIGPAHFPD